MNHLFYIEGKFKDRIFNHRELVGNDENVFDSIGYNIPTGTLTRWPFAEYHTDYDNIEITDKFKLEEVINFTLNIIDILENDKFISGLYKGIPCLSNPEINLY